MAQQAGPTLETVIQEAFRVGAQVVLSSRVYQSNKQPEQATLKRKAWFNLELDELESANKALEPWRRDVGRPLVLEIFLQPWGAVEPQALQHGQMQAQVETVLETWVFHYQPAIMPQGPSLTRSQLSRLNPTSIYKRLIIMLRSLFCYVRVLPAYRMFRVCKRQRGSNFTIGYRVSGTLPKRPVSAAMRAAAPVGSGSSSSKGRGKGRSLQHFEFAPVDTPYGQFKVSVAYQPASKVTLLEQTTSPPPLPQIIADYVGGIRPLDQLPLRHAMSASLCSEMRATQTAQQTVHIPHTAAAPASPSGTGALQRQANAFTPLPRHSWSSSAMRISPNRLLSPYSYPQQQLAQQSPFDHEATPYGSAPQLSPLHSPQLLRALSGKQIGTSPRSRPPLPPSRVLEGSTTPAGSHLGARPIPQGRARSSTLPSQQEGVEGEVDEHTAAGSSARQSSAPMSIPGRSPCQTRRLHSSGDLWGMHQVTEQPKPLSAPAISHLQRPRTQPGPQDTAAMGSHTTDGASLPPGPLPLIPGSQLESESSGSTASSALFPTSCSPQLPFAFTPSAQSLASYGSKGPMQESALERISPRLRRTSSSAGGAAGPLQQAATSASPTSWGNQGRSPLSAAGGSGQRGQGQHVQFAEEVSTVVVTGREVSTSAALARRASWSGRSYAHLRKSSMEGVGYSVSPMQDPLMDLVLGGSTPRQYSFGVPTPQYGPLGGSVRPGLSRTDSSVSGGTPPQLLTYPSLIVDASRSGNLEEQESDVLPFALDGYGGVGPSFPQPSKTQPEGFGSPAPLPPASLGDVPQSSDQAMPISTEVAENAACVRKEASSDAAVGAFVRLLQEAPPLRSTISSSEGAAGARAGGASGAQLTLQAGLKQFELIKERLHSRGAVRNVVGI